jgi:hypothetical protein
MHVCFRRDLSAENYRSGALDGPIFACDSASVGFSRQRSAVRARNQSLIFPARIDSDLRARSGLAPWSMRQAHSESIEYPRGLGYSEMERSKAVRKANCVTERSALVIAHLLSMIAKIVKEELSSACLENSTARHGKRRQEGKELQDA